MSQQKLTGIKKKGGECAVVTIQRSERSNTAQGTSPGLGLEQGRIWDKLGKNRSCGEKMGKEES